MFNLIWDIELQNACPKSITKRGVWRPWLIHCSWLSQKPIYRFSGVYTTLSSSIFWCHWTCVSSVGCWEWLERREVETPPRPGLQPSNYHLQPTEHKPWCSLGSFLEEKSLCWNANLVAACHLWLKHYNHPQYALRTPGQLPDGPWRCYVMHKVPLFSPPRPWSNRMGSTMP